MVAFVAAGGTAVGVGAIHGLSAAAKQVAARCGWLALFGRWPTTAQLLHGTHPLPTHRTPPTAPLVQVNECTAELKANLQEEHLAGMEFIGTVFKTILSPLQKARAIVQSYPFYPDVYQVGAVAVAATAAVVGH